MTDLPPMDFLLRLADAADRQTLPRFRRHGTVDAKEGRYFDPVTEADREAERAIRDLLGAEFPHHAILGEEFGASGEGPYTWVIDPVDGTRSFICGIPLWGTLIGLNVEGRAELGLLSQPYLGERFSAGPQGAFLNGPGGQRRLATRDTRALADATLFTTAPELFAGPAKERFGELSPRVRMSRYGADCYAFAMLADGHVDLCVETGLKPYDIVALIPIVEKAGGVISTWDGGRPEAGGDILAAATPELHAAALEALRR
ncbi:histidinol-phosphatase [Aureimonas populi]|uniref:Histidinol-phosphatase n=1 Tax=Aureimonas populi TaxID=1701758 RepID=A0ABW5CII3_9HYPH|nr:histidinol-phosphatase [Aureimonas populi]